MSPYRRTSSRQVTDRTPSAHVSVVPPVQQPTSRTSTKGSGGGSPGGGGSPRRAGAHRAIHAHRAIAAVGRAATGGACPKVKEARFQERRHQPQVARVHQPPTLKVPKSYRGRRQR